MIFVTNKAPHIRSRVAEIAGGTLVLVVEVNYKDPRAYAELDAFMTDALAPWSTYTDDVLRRVAEGISARLVDDEHYRQTVGAVVFSGVHVFSDHAEVFTVGDVRTHVVDGYGAVIHVTRDHNALSDDEAGIYSGSNHPGLEWVLTRTLPYALEGRSGPPEYFRWDLPPRSSTYVCSSWTHRFRPPAEYLSTLKPVNGAVEGVPEQGFAAIIIPADDAHDSERAGG